MSGDSVEDTTVRINSVAHLCPALCDPTDCSTPGFPVHHQFLEFTQIHVHCVGKAVKLSHPLSSPSPPTLNLEYSLCFIQPSIKISRKNISNLRYADDTTLMAKSEEELKSLLMKEESEKSWLTAQHLENEDHGIWSHHFMANRWGNSRNSVRLYFGGAPKSPQMVTAAMKFKDAYSLEGKLWPT